jgi:hypothetical protein
MHHSYQITTHTLHGEMSLIRGMEQEMMEVETKLEPCNLPLMMMVGEEVGTIEE